MLVGDRALIVAAVGDHAIQPALLSTRRRNTLCVPVIDEEGPVKLIFSLCEPAQSLGIKATIISTKADLFGAPAPQFQTINPGGFLEVPAPSDYPCRVALSFELNGLVVGIGQLIYGNVKDFELMLYSDASTWALTRLPGTSLEQVIDFLRRGHHE